MPSHSVEQAKTMSAIAHGWHPKGSASHIPLKVAKEFHAADTGHKYGEGREQGGGLISGFAEPDEHRDFGGGMTRPPNPNWMVRNEARSMLHSGPISSIVPGRTDRHNVHVASGSYVMPADAVSHLGQNNTKAGQAILSRMFSQGPYGSGLPKMGHGSTMPKGPGKMAAIPAAHIQKFQSAGGGKDDKTGEPVPVVVAGGEFTIPPEAVAVIGGGDIKRGHRILDNWVMALRKKHIATLKGLPPPVKS